MNDHKKHKIMEKIIDHVKLHVEMHVKEPLVIKW